MPPKDYYLPQRRLISQEDQAVIQPANVPRSRFMNSWSRKTAFDAGYLVPFLLDEVLPGDHMQYNVTAYVRLSTPLFPLFDNQRVDTFFFFVPNRLVWDNWAAFMGEQSNPATAPPNTVPIINAPNGGYGVNSLYDHFGLPGPGQVDPGQNYSHIALPFRAYNLIYNQWFKDENLTIDAPVNRASAGPDNTADYTMRRRAKSHDYFTSALPWPQKFVAPSVPLAGNAPVIGIGYEPNAGVIAGPANFWETNKSAVTSYLNYQLTSQVQPIAVNMDAPGGGAQNKPLIFADLSQVTGVAINTFRQAFLVQQLLERDARGGTRYVELIKSHFGVTNPDYRLQRPEYIGGGQTPLNITPIAQTAPTTGVPLGALGATGTAAGSHRASYAATEHGYIIGLINVRTELSYQQGIHKMHRRSTRYDFYWPSLAGLGEQAILSREIFADGTANDETVFGYQERWHEYRARYSEVTGKMKSYVTGTLDAWHLAQRFTARPTLNTAFIEDTPPMVRVLSGGSATTDQQYFADIFIHRNAVRPIPMFGTPVTLGRF